MSWVLGDVVSTHLRSNLLRENATSWAPSWRGSAKRGEGTGKTKNTRSRFRIRVFECVFSRFSNPEVLALPRSLSLSRPLLSLKRDLRATRWNVTLHLIALAAVQPRHLHTYPAYLWAAFPAETEKDVSNGPVRRECQWSLSLWLAAIAWLLDPICCSENMRGIASDGTV